MQHVNRRSFLSRSTVAATACAVDLSFLARLGHGAGDTAIHPNEVVFGSETDRLLRLIRSSSREQCVPAFAREIKAGLSYRQFVTVLFLAAVENGDPHQVAQVYGAHRISTDARAEERLLPLFWVLNRIKQEHEPSRATLKPFRSSLPTGALAASIFRESMLKSDSENAVRAALALARDRGARHVMHRLWEFASRNVGDNLGHPAIALANSYRALEAMGWQHAEVALRYVTGYIAGYKGDKTYAPNLERVRQTVPGLGPDWAAAVGERNATVDLYHLLRAGKADEACALICSQLLSNKVKAGAAWDAIALAAADSIFRHKIGGGALGAQVHAVTTTNALRYGFDLMDVPQVKLSNLLQAAGVVSDFYVRQIGKEGVLRDVSLLDLKNSADSANRRGRGIGDVFESLPFKSREHTEPQPGEREASDQACRMAFALLGNADNHEPFMQTARSFLCVKASLDPHDIKFPAAAFEDASSVSSEWKPYLLASSVHALHGSRSNDIAVLTQVREAWK